MRRKTFLTAGGAAALTVAVGSSLLVDNAAQAFAFQPSNITPVTTTPGVMAAPNTNNAAATVVAYKPLSISLDEFSVNVPVACWFPVSKEQQAAAAASTSTTSYYYDDKVNYNHRISVRKIGQLLANWNSIPGFVARNYALQPTTTTSSSSSSSSHYRVVDASNAPLPTTTTTTTTTSSSQPSGGYPVVMLAHGYLGSRFDLSHLAEELAAAGFVCLAAEYPESLAASYDPVPGLDRNRINQVLLDTIQNQWNIPVSAHGIVGHSLGCGTAIQTGDDSWTRVLISGFPRQRDGTPLQAPNMLLLASMNDGLMNRYLADKSNIPSDFNLLEESALLAAGTSMSFSFPAGRSMLLFDRPDAPNHISFLSPGVNDAMIEFLSPLLPVARMFDIPVLDFDRYQESRDSIQTSKVVHPIVLRYLQQEMLGTDKKI